MQMEPVKDLAPYLACLEWHAYTVPPPLFVYTDDNR